MNEAFIIMRIGDRDLDRVCAEAVVPALKECGLSPKRVDKHNKGGLLKSEMVEFMRESDIVVADLTYARPNCYLEVGYVMGLGKLPNLVLTAREDHNSRDERFKSQGDYRVHFDLDGYDILFWNPQDVAGFRKELAKRVKRRLEIIRSRGNQASQALVASRVTELRARASRGLEARGMTTFMEYQLVPLESALEVTQKDLLGVARSAAATGSGWPIGVVVNDGSHGPSATKDGIVQEFASDVMGTSYDFWSLMRDGSFFLTQNHWAAQVGAKVKFGNNRADGATPLFYYHMAVQRIAEALIYAQRLYAGLELAPSAKFRAVIRHAGLEGLVLAAPTGRMPLRTARVCREAEVETELVASRQEVESDLVGLVDHFARPLFILFDFFEIPLEDLADLVRAHFPRGFPWAQGLPGATHPA